MEKNMSTSMGRASEWTLEKVQGAAAKLGTRHRATSGTSAR